MFLCVRARFSLGENLPKEERAKAVGYVIAGQARVVNYVNRFGRKRLTFLATLTGGFVTIAYTNVLTLIISIGLVSVAAFANGVRNSSASSLTLEQVPRYRGIIMSLFSASDNLGTAFGAGIGGSIIIFYNYRILGAVLGFIGVLSAAIFYFLTKDPLIPLSEACA
jgi:MFS family permease